MYNSIYFQESFEKAVASIVAVFANQEILDTRGLLKDFLTFIFKKDLELLVSMTCLGFNEPESVSIPGKALAQGPVPGQEVADVRHI